MAKSATLQEDPISLQDAAASTKASLSYWTLYRWATEGLRGVKLESWFIGGKRYTSMAAIDRFNARQTALRNGQAVDPPTSRKKRSDSARAKLKSEFGV